MLLRARTALTCILLIFTLAGTLSAQSEYKVVDIEVVGNRVATRSLILGVSAVIKGSPLTATIIQESIHRLYGLGIFSDVTLKAEEISGGLKVYIVVKELPKLSGLEFTGNKKIKSKDLKDALGLGVGGYISPYLIHEKKQTILSKYAEKGYFQAEVDWEIKYSDDSTEAQLVYKVDERSKVKVKKVIMTGNSRVKAGDLIKKMRNRKRGFLKSSDFAKDEYNLDKEKIIEEYHKKGYIDAFLISDSIAIDTSTNQMTIYLEVFEGPLYYFGKVSLDGNDVLPSDLLESVLKYEENKVFDSEKYDESLFELYSTYQEIGHLHVRVLDEKVTRDDSLIDVKYTISEGLPSHINLVNIVGNTKTKDKVIRRELSVRPGQTFNRSLLIRSVRDAMALNFFANVEPVPINLPNGDVDLEFRIEEKQTGQISAGAGYNSQDKVVGSVGMGIPNFRGNGQNLTFNIDFGSRRNSFSISFTEPWLFGRPTLFGVDIFTLNRRWFNDYTEGRQGGSLRLGRRLRWPDNYFRVFTTLRLERNRFYDYDEVFESRNSSGTTFKYNWTEIDTSQIDTLVINSKNLSEERIGEALPGSVTEYNELWNTAAKIAFSITRDSRNLPEFASSGSQFSYTFENTGGVLGGFWQYQRHKLTLAKFIPLFGNISLAAKVQYGAIISASSDIRDRKVLITDRYNPGGTAFDGTVRGYSDGILTPDSIVSGIDTTAYYYGDPSTIDIENQEADSSVTSPAFTTRVRGKFMLVANAEIQIPISERQIYALLFFDAGNSYLSHKHIKPFRNLYRGYGIGFRVAVPGIGTIGFDFAKPLDDPPDGEKKAWRPHFQIGTTFR